MGALSFVDLLKQGLMNPNKVPPYFRRKINQYKHVQTATNIYEKNWDLLLLLDCARPDMMREVQNDYRFLDEIGEITSVATCSRQWMENTFVTEYMEQMGRTVHVTANTASDAALSKKQFQHLEEVWRDGWDEELRTIPAEEVTDRTIHFMRKTDAERYIVHYMQPHLPFVTRPDIDSRVVTTAGVQAQGKNLADLHKAGYSKEELWEASLENLRYVLDSVEVLLSNVDAERAIISADHGQAFGEGNVWSHPCFEYIDPLTQVPWCLTSATDSGNYTPEYEPTATTDGDISLEDKLEALGYKG
ncbi:hypothetical protein [Haloarcula onubensis]|uniref:Sulfatase N-terminal domain-containing protein n=1 Tax=Haloarcula onubensis TaxID=2950539 RepID=A0ABU2FIF4_9EURY|nr:hypothetical protein [Halomicroarcula sp. S3CR25-11]MDS0280546.1 hypothetical protein [Halomicroarcula sp. S3CR25-11]